MTVFNLHEASGINLPLITFSFMPISLSERLLIAVSVSTRVVSWKQAANSQDSVAGDSFYDTHDLGARCRQLATVCNGSGVDLVGLRQIHQGAGQELGEARGTSRSAAIAFKSTEAHCQVQPILNFGLRSETFYFILITWDIPTTVTALPTRGYNTILWLS